MRKNFLAVFFCLSCFSICFAQKEKKELQIGGKIVNELTFYNGLAPGFGGQLVYRMRKHSGIESGIYYQAKYYNLFVSIQSGNSNNSYFTRIAERNLQIPILYRHDAKFINFSAGIIMDYFLGWQDKTKNPNVIVNSFNRNAVNLIVAAGISKSIHLTSSLILEPEARFNFIITDEDGGLSLNIALRKRIF